MVARSVTMLKHSNVSLHLTHTPESPIMSPSKHVNPYSKPLISLVRLCSTKYSGAAIKPTIHNKTVINLKLFDAVAAIKFRECRPGFKIIVLSRVCFEYFNGIYRIS